MSTRYGANGDMELHHRVINKKSAVTTPDTWEPALPVVKTMTDEQKEIFEK